jgi:hypothetical protein
MFQKEEHHYHHHHHQNRQSHPELMLPKMNRLLHHQRRQFPATQMEMGLYRQQLKMDFLVLLLLQGMNLL